METPRIMEKMNYFGLWITYSEMDGNKSAPFPHHLEIIGQIT